jgi:integrase
MTLDYHPVSPKELTMQRTVRPPRIALNTKGTYYVHYHDGKSSRKESLGTADIEVAKKNFAYWLTDTGKKETPPTIAELCTLYDNEHVDGVADPERQRNRLKHIVHHFGALTIEELRPIAVQKYIENRKAAPGTIKGELVALRTVLNHNLRAGRIEKCPHIKVPKVTKPEIRWLSSNEVAHLLGVAAGRRSDGLMSRAERYCWIALETGARKRSIETLQWDQVNFETGVIDFRTPGKVETKKRQAVVPISDRLRPMLSKAYEERTGSYVLGTSADARKGFDTLMKAAGLTGVTPHGLRHTAATLMANAGVPLYQIAAMLGNSVAMVDATYAHHCPDALRDAINYER